MKTEDYGVYGHHSKKIIKYIENPPWYIKFITSPIGVCVMIYIMIAIVVNFDTGSTKNAGSAKELKGNTYVLSIFLSDSNNQWTYNEKQKMINDTYEAQNWLKKQATLYNLSIDFANERYGLHKDIKLRNIPSSLDSQFDSKNKPLITQVFNEIGWSSSLYFYEATGIRESFDNMLVLLFVKDAGVSYAMNVPKGFPKDDRYKDNRHDRYVESTLVYHKYADDVIDDRAGTIVHEMLHLFGSIDFYEETRNAFIWSDRKSFIFRLLFLDMKIFKENKLRKRSRETYPNSIMNSSRLTESTTIDPLTAWLIGWTKD